MTFTLVSGMIVDGLGSDPYIGNVVVQDDRIVAIGAGVEPIGDQIDVSGLAVSPGFIDMHSHCDRVCMSDPQLSPKILQGVTLELLGQDGLSEAPMTAEGIAGWRKHLSGLNGDPDISWDWRGFGEYIERCAGAATNVAGMVGHGTVRYCVMGMANRAPTEAEMGEMRALVDQALAEGAAGFSTGLIYSPGVYSDTDELINIGTVVNEHNSFMVYHMRYEGESILKGMDEVFEIARTSGSACHISHFKALGRRAWGKSPEMIDAVEKARSAGLDITADQYPYTAGSTMLAALLPPWAHAEGIDELNRMLKDSMAKDRMQSDMVNGRDDWESSVVAAGYENIRISSVTSEKNAWAVGKSLIQIAENWSIEPFEAVVRLLLEEDHEVSMILFAIDEDDVQRLIVQPWLMIGSDGLMGGTPHPRTYGTFARVIGHYARELGMMTLAEGVRKMTGLPAWRLGIPDRGVLREGNYADITVFDPDTVIDRATFEDPSVHPDGIMHVFVNGQQAVANGNVTGILAGRAVRREVPAPGTQSTPKTR